MNDDLATLVGMFILTAALFGYMVYLIVSGIRHADSHKESSYGSTDAAKKPKRPSLSDFLRILLLERAGVDFEDYSRELYQAAIGIRSMSELELMGTPEATAVTIVQAFDLAKRVGADDPDILEKIEAHRGGTTRKFDAEMSLQTYIEYRVNLEHERQGQDFAKFISTWISIGREFFKGVESGEYSDEWVSRICRPIAGISGTHRDSQAQNMPDAGSLAMGMYKSAMQTASESKSHLLAVKMASSAIQAANELVDKGQVAEALLVVTHFKQQEAFAYLSPERQAEIDNVFNMINAALNNQEEGDGWASTGQTASNNFFQLSGHSAELVDNPELPGPIEYFYALIVRRDSDNKTEFIVTAEKQFSIPGIEGLLKESEFFSDVDLGDVSGGVVLGVLSDHGHENYGASPEYSDREKFVEKALQLAKQRLGISTDK